MEQLETHIAVNKNRIKEYNDRVYLKNNSNFQIELFNGKSDTFGVLIELNGSPISNKKLVIQPGERVFLDRYIDDQRKFLFKTYDVDGNSNEVKRAIRKNGTVKVKFYKEISLNQQWNGTIAGRRFAGVTNQSWYINTNTPSHQSSTADYLTYNINDSYNISTTANTVLNTVYSTTTNNTSDAMLYNSGQITRRVNLSKNENKGVKTGRIGKGTSSGQQLHDVDMEFDSFHTYESILQILPEENRSTYISSEIRNYCNDCGRKLKGSWKFCATCGNKL